MSWFRKVMCGALVVGGLMASSAFMRQARAENGFWTVYALKPGHTTLTFIGNYNTEEDADDAMDMYPAGWSFITTEPDQGPPN